MIKSKIMALFSKLRAESLSNEYFDICSMKRVEMSQDLNQEFLKPALSRKKSLLTGKWVTARSLLIARLFDGELARQSSIQKLSEYFVQSVICIFFLSLITRLRYHRSMLSNSLLSDLSSSAAFLWAHSRVHSFRRELPLKFSSWISQEQLR